MRIYGEDANEVRFNGSIDVVHTVTIGNTGWDGALQLRTKNEQDTIFLGSTDTEAHALLGHLACIGPGRCKGRTVAPMARPFLQGGM
jgi:hypothetical protein